MEEKDLKEKMHVCKLCDKRFPCGRSLGGHMRSHVILMNNNSDQNLIKAKKNLSSLNSNGDLIGETGYRLRENPKKSYRFAGSRFEDDEYVDEDEDENNFVNDLKMCKECGKGFPSWKALSGHMKCHSDNKVQILEEQSSSWTNNNNSQSDNDTSARQSRKARQISRRRSIRYMADSNTTANSSSLSLANYASSSLLEIEHEQQEVALCLMMLSRDVTNWAYSNSDEESSDHYDYDRDSVIDSRNGSKLNRKVEELVLNKNNSSKKRLRDDDLVVNSSKKTSYFDNLDSEFCKKSYKSNKFECNTCNKIFCSYQALGGHRASHKKIKGCSVSISKSENKENPIESDTEHVIKNGEKKNAGDSRIKVYECPVCFKVFSSGQALGGHKRSHVLNGSEAKYGDYHDPAHEATVIQNKNHEFIDLNLPAPNEEENHHMINGNDGFKFKPWWTENPLLV